MALVFPVRRAKGENSTAAILNQFLRDNLNLLHWRGAYQTADVTKNNDATLANLTGLSIPVVSGDVWLFGGHSFFISNATADAKWAVTTPAGSTQRYGIVGAGTGIGDSSSTISGTGLAAGTSSVEDNEIFFGHVIAGADGAIQIQAAQNTPTVVNTIFRQYSSLIGFRISSIAGTSPIPSFSSSQVLDAGDLQTLISNALNAIAFKRGLLREDVIANQETAGQALPGMSFPVRAGEIWAWFAFMYFVSNDIANIAFGATAPAVSTGRYGIGASGTPITAGSSPTFGTMVKAGVPAATQQHANFNGVIEAVADGEVQLQMAQSTSTAVNTTVHQDSHFVAFRLAA